ncbi:MAG: hypothetical protein Q7S51_03675 [Gallionellaceae bacterium]|nr:hypothetical protein [Gallionellaceae bacterium]
MERLIATVLKSQILSTHMAYLTKKSALLFLGLAFFGATPSLAVTIPESDEYYPGASLAFTAIEPYTLNIQGTPTTYTLWGFPRSYDFSGKVDFVNSQTGKADPAQFLYNGTIVNGDQITNAGVAGRIEKRTNQAGEKVTMVRYLANDDITGGACRTQLSAYAIPPRTHVRWDLKVAFGGVDETENNWNLTTSGISPVLFWQVKSSLPTNPPLSAIVDTDSLDASKLMIFFSLMVGNATSPVRIAEVHGLSRYTQIPIVIEAFLDERPNPPDGVGKGALKIWVNNLLITDMATPTLQTGTVDTPLPTHNWHMNMYLYKQTSKYLHTRASFWKTAKMIVFPKPD